MNLTLTSECQADCTVGTLTCGDLTLHTIEPAWRDNKPDVSCVPAGTYQLLPYLSPRHGRTWRLHAPALNVWGLDSAPPTPMRTEVEIHTGNVASESEACLLVGMAASTMMDKSGAIVPAVLDSVIALGKLRELTDGASEEETLTILRTGLYTDYQQPVEVAA